MSTRFGTSDPAATYSLLNLLDDDINTIEANMTAFTPALNFLMGTIQGWWKRVGGISNLIAVSYHLVVASGYTPNSGGNTASLTISLPVNAAAYAQISGAGTLIRSGAYHALGVRGVNTGQIGLFLPGSGTTAGTVFAGNTWTSWAVGDAIELAFIYRA